MLNNSEKETTVEGLISYLDANGIKATVMSKGQGTAIIELEDGNIYEITISESGGLSVGFSEITDDFVPLDIDLKAEEIGFTYTPAGWTKGEVRVTARITDSTKNLEGYTLKLTSDIKTSPTMWSNAEAGITMNTNGAVYAFLVNAEGKIGAVYATGNVEKIDTNKPTVFVTNVTTNSITFVANDVAKTNESASGAVEYSYTKEANTYNWKTFLGDTVTEKGLTQGDEYYVYVRDRAGNVSNVASGRVGTVPSIEAGDITFSYSTSNWTNGSVKVTASLKSGSSAKGNGYRLMLTTDVNSDVSSWVEAETGITMTTNGQVYAVLVDSSDQKGDTTGVANVEKIDTSAPEVSQVTATTNKIIFSGSETAKANEQQSGIVAYGVTLGNSAPTGTGGLAGDRGLGKWISCSSTETLSNIELNGYTQSRTYYVWTKDAAGNVSTGVATTAQTVALSKGNIGNTITWSGTTATVHFTTTTGYYIQTSANGGQWSSNPANTGAAEITVETGGTVYARLTDSTGQYNSGDVAAVTPILTYTVVYDGNGATSGSTANSTHSYGTEKTLTQNGYTKTGYKFVGWNSDANATTISYTDKQGVTNLSSTNGATVRLYAIWVAVPSKAEDVKNPTSKEEWSVENVQSAIDDLLKSLFKSGEMNAADVEYEPEDNTWDVDNVQEAIDYLNRRYDND